MNILKPHYYDEFTCIGGECPDTCYAGWNIKNVPEEFGDKLRNLVKEDEKIFFIFG